MYRLNLGDVGQRIWFMGWLPYAIGHGLNPFISGFMFAPRGFNLLSNANVLFEALVLAPVTELFSPVASFNVACIAAPVVSALSLCFVLRRYRMRWTVSFVAGFIYGFAPALLQADRIGDVNLSWLFFPPRPYISSIEFFRQTGNDAPGDRVWSVDRHPVLLQLRDPPR